MGLHFARKIAGGDDVKAMAAHDVYSKAGAVAHGHTAVDDVSEVGVLTHGHVAVEGIEDTLADLLVQYVGGVELAGGRALRNAPAADVCRAIAAF